jgi:hypothetical protein
MALLLSARLGRNLERLHTMCFDPAAKLADIELAEILVATLENLHGLYPAYTLEGSRYMLLQHLAVLDLQHQAQIDAPLFFTVPANALYAYYFICQAATHPGTPTEPEPHLLLWLGSVLPAQHSFGNYHRLIPSVSR